MKEKEKENKVIIGFDAKRAAQNATGLGNYSRFVIESVAKFMPAWDVRLYVPNPRRSQLLNRLPEASLTDIRSPRSDLWRRLRSLWRVWGITHDLRKEPPSLFHGLSNELPLNIRRSGVKSIVTIHDLIFRHYPECYKPIDRAIYDYKFRRACSQADRVIAVSECTKRDIIYYYNIPATKIDVVYQGCDGAFRSPISQDYLNEICRRYHLPARYVLYVGSIEKRKNLLLLAKAIELLPDDVDVIAVGRRTPYADEVENYLRRESKKNRLRMLSDVPFADLPSLYQLSSAFAYPSRYEGFGIPILEALCSGVPVVACTGSCLEEAGGPSSLYVSPDDASALGEALNRVLADEALRQKMIIDGLRYAENFLPDKLWTQLYRIYENVAQGIT